MHFVLINIIGGNIGIESVKGEGTTVWFTVPFNRKITGQVPDNISSDDTPSSSSALAIEDTPRSSPDTSNHTNGHGSSTASESTNISRAAGGSTESDGDYPRNGSPKMNNYEHKPNKRGSYDATPLFVDEKQYEIWASPKPLEAPRRSSVNPLDLDNTQSRPKTPPQPQYNQPQHNQSQYNQPQHNQPQHNQHQHNQPNQPTRAISPPSAKPHVEPPAPLSTSQQSQPVQPTQTKQPSQSTSKLAPESHNVATQPKPQSQPRSASPISKLSYIFFLRFPSFFFPLTILLLGDKPMVVLVVDDIPLNRDIAVALLSKENCKCDVAVDGVEAVAAFKQKQYHSFL